MALHAEEEETIENLKAWWRAYGRRLATIVIVVLATYTAWLLWENNQSATADAASDLYEQVLDRALADEGETISEADSEEIIALAGQLKSEYPDTDYARFASLFEAQQHVRLDDLQAAQAALQWVLDNPREGLFTEPDPGLMLTTSLRLGRVLLAQGETEQALELVNSVDPQGFEAGYAELRGDIYAAMGREVDAREAYLAAQQAGSRSDALRMKLNSLSNDS